MSIYLQSYEEYFNFFITNLTLRAHILGFTKSVGGNLSSAVFSNFLFCFVYF